MDIPIYIQAKCKQKNDLVIIAISSLYQTDQYISAYHT